MWVYVRILWGNVSPMISRLTAANGERPPGQPGQERGGRGGIAVDILLVAPDGPVRQWVVAASTARGQAVHVVTADEALTAVAAGNPAVVVVGSGVRSDLQPALCR